MPLAGCAIGAVETLGALGVNGFGTAGAGASGAAASPAARALAEPLNLALVGDELIQFGRATPVAGGRWALSDLWRGRRGTEWASDAHAVGERFVLVDPDVLVSVPLPLATIGGQVRVLASGVGDADSPAEAATLVDGASCAAAPVGLTWEPSGSGDAIIRWTRRSRAGWIWADGGDAPLVEESERYRVTIGSRDVIDDRAAGDRDRRRAVRGGDRRHGPAARHPLRIGSRNDRLARHLN